MEAAYVAQLSSSPRPFFKQGLSLQSRSRHKPTLFLLLRWQCQPRKSQPLCHSISDTSLKLLINQLYCQRNLIIQKFTARPLKKLNDKTTNFSRKKSFMTWLPCKSPRAKNEEGESSRTSETYGDESGSLEESSTGIVSDEVESEEKANEKVRVEVSGSVVKMLQGLEDETKEKGMSLIENNQKKRRARFASMQEDKQHFVELKASGSFSKNRDQEQVAPKTLESGVDTQDQAPLKIYNIGIEQKDPRTIFLENNAVSIPYTKTFNDLWPETAVSFTELVNKLANRTPITRKVLESVQLDVSSLKEVIQNDLECIAEVQLLPSTLFLDINGVPLSVGATRDSESRFLLLMYILYRLFHKLNYFSDPASSETLYWKMFLDRVLQAYSCVADQEELHRNVLKASSFSTENRWIKTRHGILFLGKIVGSAFLALRQIQNNLDQNYKGLSALLLQTEPIKGLPSADDMNEMVWCLIARNRSVWSFSLTEQYNQLLGSICLAGAMFGGLQFDIADPGLEHYIQWERGLVPLGLVGVVAGASLARKMTATFYDVPHLLSFPFLLPVLHQGALTSWVPYKGCLPNRSCLLNLSVFSSCGSLAISCLFAFLGTYPSLPWNHHLTTMADFRGCLFVPSDMFSYSSILTWMLERLSIATLSESGKLQYVMNPLALVSVLGFNFTFSGLIPGSALDGGRILTAVFGRTVQRTISPALYLLPVFSLCFKSPLLGLLWVALMPFTMTEDLFQRDEVSEPNFFWKALGLVLVSAGILSFVPVFW